MKKNEEVVRIGIGEWGIVQSPVTIRTAGLGSCVGVIIYDKQRHIAGMAHVMLPDSTMIKRTTDKNAKYADVAIELLIQELCKQGARRTALVAKLSGGAQMFQFQSNSDVIRIGPRNVEAVKEQLNKHEINVISEDVGGNNGRTIEFNPETSMLNIRAVNQEVKEI